MEKQAFPKNVFCAYKNLPTLCFPSYIENLIRSNEVFRVFRFFKMAAEILISRDRLKF